MRPILLILTLICSLQAVQWPVGTKAVIPFTVNKTMVGESATNFCYEIKIVTDTRFRNAFNSDANIVIFDTLTGLIRPSRIWYYTKDTVFAEFDGALTNSINKTFHACAGPAINRVNSAQTYTNSGITNKWGFDEPAGSTTALDYAGGVNGTVESPATITAGGLFGNCLNKLTQSYGGVICASDVFGVGDVSIDFVFTVTQLSGYQNLLWNDRLGIYINATGSIWVESGGDYTTYAKSVNCVSPNTWYCLSVKRRSNGDVSIVLNGQSITMTVINSGSPLSGTTTRICGFPGSFSFVGLMDNVYVYKSITSTSTDQTRSAMLMQPEQFWTQGQSFGVGGGKRNVVNLHIGSGITN